MGGGSFFLGGAEEGGGRALPLDFFGEGVGGGDMDESLEESEEGIVGTEVGGWVEGGDGAVRGWHAKWRQLGGGGERGGGSAIGLKVVALVRQGVVRASSSVLSSLSSSIFIFIYIYCTLA